MVYGLGKKKLSALETLSQQNEKYTRQAKQKFSQQKKNYHSKIKNSRNTKN